MILLYDLILLFVILIHSVKKPHHFLRIFAKIPDPQAKEVIWIHAVSVGEAKSIQTFFHSLRSDYPGAFFLITTTTATGQAEARRSLSSADAFAFLPVDLRWIVRRWVRKLRPKLFFLVESDFWPNLLFAIKKNGGKAILISGKLSKRSGRRFAFFRQFSRKLFACLDLLCVQNIEHAERFLSFVAPSRLHIGGNLKFDYLPPTVDLSFWQKELCSSLPPVTLSCTHAFEEEELLDLLPLDHLFLFLAPRHPERFQEVACILEKKKISYFRWTRVKERRGEEKVCLIDTMGQLSICYALSRFAIVGGSFQPGVGGHNILEPCFYGVPVFFGPYMDAQQELVHRVLSARAGVQVHSVDLPHTIQAFLTSPSQQAALRAAAVSLVEACRGASAKTLHILRTYLEKV